jgi:hypothetical protein
MVLKLICPWPRKTLAVGLYMERWQLNESGNNDDLSTAASSSDLYYDNIAVHSLTFSLEQQLRVCSGPSLFLRADKQLKQSS